MIHISRTNRGHLKLKSSRDQLCQANYLYREIVENTGYSVSMYEGKLPHPIIEVYSDTAKVIIRILTNLSFSILRDPNTWDMSKSKLKTLADNISHDRFETENLTALVERFMN